MQKLIIVTLIFLCLYSVLLVEALIALGYRLPYPIGYAVGIPLYLAARLTAFVIATRRNWV